MQLYHNYKDAIRRFYERRMDLPPVFDPDEWFPNHTKFTAAWRAIRDEAIAARVESSPLLAQIVPGQKRVSTSDGVDWRMLVVRGYGVDVEENMVRMPTLAALVRECPEVTSATISFFGPHKRIPVHTGPFPGVLRFHLGLQVPLLEDGQPAAVLTIDGKDYQFADGESLLWDDTLPHEAVNRSGEPRIALLLDVWRTGMPPSVERLSRVIYGVIRTRMRMRGPQYMD